MQKAIISINVNTGVYKNFVSQLVDMTDKPSSYICIANVHMLVKASREPSFAKIINDADLITPDGMPLTWALKLLYGIDQDRVAGMDLLPDLLTKAEQELIPVYFYGGTEKMHAKIQETIPNKYPLLNIAGMYSPPFREITDEEAQCTATSINNSGAKIVFVILGCPKQEIWMAKMKGKINAAMLGVGGALPVLLGIQKRAPLWMQKAGLEWFYRLIKEPKRLFKRYFITNSMFIFLLTREFIRIKILNKNTKYPIGFIEKLTNTEKKHSAEKELSKFKNSGNPDYWN